MFLDLIAEYNARKGMIRERLKKFKSVWNQSEKRVFSELCFCICTPQSKAVYCDKAISDMEKSGVLFNGTLSMIKLGLNGVRFSNNKARYLLGAREFFTENGVIRIKNRINKRDVFAVREWFVKNVKGFGPKEASHFLRNIGFGENLAILDTHVLKNMVKYGIIKEVPSIISKTAYLMLEEKLRKFSKDIGISMAEIDLLFWSMETGIVLK